MNLAEAIHSIEQPEFSAHVNIASSLKVFLRLLVSHEAVQTLLRLMDQSGVPEKILERVSALLSNEPPEGFEHPDDAALAAYLWLLGEKSAVNANVAASLIREGIRLHWAKSVADRVGQNNQNNGPGSDTPAHKKISVSP
jgi:hypothetical protein